MSALEKLIEYDLERNTPELLKPFLSRAVAQRSEPGSHKPRVAGSNPAGATKLDRRYHHSYETRVAACADYLIGRLSLKEIAYKYGIPEPTIIVYWISKRGCFKLRRPRQRM